MRVVKGSILLRIGQCWKDMRMSTGKGVLEILAIRDDMVDIRE